MMVRVLSAAALAAALLCNTNVHAKEAEGPLRFVGDDGIPVQIGADDVGFAVPVPVQIDIFNDPVGEEWRPGDPIREIPRQHWDDPAVHAAGQRPPVNRTADELDWLARLQREYDAAAQPLGDGFTVPLLNFEAAPGTTFPPDPTGDIGPNHYVQAVNASGGTRVRVFDKTNGDLVANFILTSTLQGPNPCNSGLGDPIVFYDGLADRWLLTEFSPQSGRALCVYVSSSNDPTNTAPASWFKYAFVMPSFPDYPKYGVWSDAYYVTANESGTSGARPVYAFERDRMLAGETARFVRLTVPRVNGFNFQLLTPAHHIGEEPPPAGAPGIFMRHFDDEAHTPASNDPTQDFLQLWQLTMDWSQSPTPGTTLVGPVSIPISEFNSRMNGLTAFEAFPQPNGQRLDPLREPIMNQMVYRNFGSHESIFGNLVTNLAVDPQVHGAVRWFELRRSGGIASPWQLHDEGTFAPNDAGGIAHRWMAGSAMDASGNVALAYSITRQSPAIFPSLRYVGRLADDPSGVMTTGETELAEGSRSQNADRWGDYFHMGVDPVDGCTFWFTGQYMGPPGNASNTRVAAFRHQACGEPGFTLSTSITQLAVCAAAPPVSLDPIGVTVGSVSDFTDPVNLVFNPALPAGFSGGFTPATVNPPGASSLQLEVAAGVAPGLNIVTVEGTSGALLRTRDIEFNVATSLPGQAQPVDPPDNAVNVSTTPVLTWDDGTQASSYTVEVATDAGFADIVFSGSVNNGTAIAVGTALNTNTEYFWRVTSGNVCGAGATSTVFRFRTLPAPGDCNDGQEASEVFSEDFNSGPGGFQVSGTGASAWALSDARQSPISGGQAFHATNIATVSDQLLTSPAIQLPADESPLTLMFQNWREIERNGASACWDGGILEISVNGGSFTQAPVGLLLNDPYRGPVSTGFSNPLGGLDAWCDDNPPRDWSDTLVDLTAFAGDEVRLRWRLGTDTIVAREGWYVDDVRVQSCVFTDNADLSVTKTVDPEIAVMGTNVEFTVNAANAGPIDATGVIVNDQLPSGFTFVSAIASVGSYDDNTGVWDIGGLEIEASATLTITATVEASGDYTNIATIAGDENDLNPENDSANATVIAIDPASADLSVTKQADVSGPGLGDTVVFTLTAANAGPGNATGVVVQDLLPPGYAFVSAVASAGSYDENSGEWTIGGLNNGVGATLEITTTVDVYDAWLNIATIDGDQDDPFPENNTASASANPDVPLDVFADGFE